MFCIIKRITLKLIITFFERKRNLTPFSYVGNMYGSQATAPIKGRPTNVGDRLWDGDGGQATASMKSVFTDTSD